MNLSEHADRLEAQWHDAGPPERRDRVDDELRRDLQRLVLLVDKVARGIGK